MKRANVVLAMAGLFFSLAYGSIASAQGKKPIVVGFIHTMSGPMSMYGISSEAGTQIAVEEINAAGGIMGRPLKMITRDDKLNPEVGLREAKDLLLSENVDFLSGTISSAVAQAISNYVRRQKKLYLVTIAQTPSLTEKNFNRYLFRIGTNSIPYSCYGLALGHAKKYKDKKFVSLGFDYETGKESLRGFKEKYLELIPDAQFVDELWAPLNTTDFTPFITKIANSGAQALFLAAIYGGGDLAFTKQAYAFGLHDKIHVDNSTSGDVETWCNVKKGEPYPKGVLATCRFPFWALKDPRVKIFVEKHNKKVRFFPSYGAADQYIAMYALKSAIEKVGAVDTEKIIDVMEGMVMDTFFGRVPIRAYDHQAMLPTWYGQIGFTPDLPFPHIIVEQAFGEESYHTVEQIKKIRGGK